MAEAANQAQARRMCEKDPHIDAKGKWNDINDGAIRTRKLQCIGNLAEKEGGHQAEKKAGSHIHKAVGGQSFENRFCIEENKGDDQSNGSVHNHGNQRSLRKR